MAVLNIYGNEKKWIFGAGVWAKRYYEKLSSQGQAGSVLGVIDNNRDIWGTEFFPGKAIISMDTLMNQYNGEMVVVCCAGKNEDAICEQLLGRGIEWIMRLGDEGRTKLQQFVVANRENELLHKWLFLHHMNKTIVSYFADRGMESVALYGFGEVGKRVLEEFLCEGFEVSYIVDNGPFYFTQIPRIALEDDYPQVDCMIITSLGINGEAEMKIQKQNGIKYIYLEAIVNELYQEICR